MLQKITKVVHFYDIWQHNNTSHPYSCSKRLNNLSTRGQQHYLLNHYHQKNTVSTRNSLWKNLLCITGGTSKQFVHSCWFWPMLVSIDVLPEQQQIGCKSIQHPMVIRIRTARPATCQVTINCTFSFNYQNIETPIAGCASLKKSGNLTAIIDVNTFGCGFVR